MELKFKFLLMFTCIILNGVTNSWSMDSETDHSLQDTKGSKRKRDSQEGAGQNKCPKIEHHDKLPAKVENSLSSSNNDEIINPEDFNLGVQLESEQKWDLETGHYPLSFPGGQQANKDFLSGSNANSNRPPAKATRASQHPHEDKITNLRCFGVEKEATTISGEVGTTTTNFQMPTHSSASVFTSPTTNTAQTAKSIPVIINSRDDARTPSSAASNLANGYVSLALKHSEEENKALSQHCATLADEKFQIVEDAELAERLQNEKSSENKQTLIDNTMTTAATTSSSTNNDHLAFEKHTDENLRSNSNISLEKTENYLSDTSHVNHQIQEYSESINVDSERILQFPESLKRLLLSLLESKLSGKRDFRLSPPNCPALGGAVVNCIMIDNTTFIAAAKYFEDGVNGQKEFNDSNKVYHKLFSETGDQKNAFPFSLVKILAGFKKTDAAPFLIIFEPAQGKEIFNLLSEETTLDAPFTAVADSLAALHGQTRKTECIQKEVEHYMHLEKKRINSFFSSGASNHLEQSLTNSNSKDSSSKDLLKPGEVEIMLNNLWDNIADFETNTKLLIEGNNLMLTFIHGDATNKNLFYDDAREKPITMIDYASMAMGDPAKDVARFIGSLWEWGARNNGDFEKDFKKISDWQNCFIKKYRDELKRKYCKNLDETFEFTYYVNYYKISFFRTILCSPNNPNSVKVALTKFWLEELKLQEKGQPAFGAPTTAQTESLKAPPNPSFANKLVEEISAFLPTKMQWGNEYGGKEIANSTTEEINNPMGHWNNGREQQESNAQKAKIAALNLFQPLITELTYSKTDDKLADSLTKAQEALNQILENGQDLTSVSSKIIEINDVIKLSGDSFKEFIDSCNIPLNTLATDNEISFYNSIIKLRNIIHYNILEKYFKDKPSKKCNHCEQNGLWIEKVLGEEVGQCWVCGHEEFF